MLDHFMDLVCAVRIANMRHSSQQQIIAYNRYIRRYVSRITKLFPDTALKTSHHAALHIRRCHCKFGAGSCTQRTILRTLYKLLSSNQYKSENQYV